MHLPCSTRFQAKNRALRDRYGTGCRASARSIAAARQIPPASAAFRAPPASARLSAAGCAGSPHRFGHGELDVPDAALPGAPEARSGRLPGHEASADNRCDDFIACSFAFAFALLGCVEAAGLPDGAIAVRNSRHPAGPAPIYARAGITAFLSGVKNGTFDDPYWRPGDGVALLPNSH